MTPTNLAETLAVQMRYTHWVVNATLKDVPDDRYYEAPAAGGNCLNWVLGHLVDARNGCLLMLEREPVIDKAAAGRYGRGSAPVTGPDDAVPPAELLAAFNAAQEPIVAGIAALSAEALAAPAPFSPGNDPEETVGSLLAGLVFHESYHAGQLGVIRRTLGLESIIK
jgi:uncharacterized damage-inducible protein DinB